MHYRPQVLKTISNNIVASIATETSKPSTNIIDYVIQSFTPNVKESELSKSIFDMIKFYNNIGKKIRIVMNRKIIIFIISVLLILCTIGMVCIIKANRGSITSKTDAEKMTDNKTVSDRYYLGEKYKIEVEAYIDKQAFIVEKNIEKILSDLDKHYENFIKNNYKELSKEDYCLELGKYEITINSEDFYFYKGILDLTNKYKKVSVSSTGSSDIVADALMPYFKANNVDLKRTKKMYKYMDKAYKRIEEYNKKIMKVNTFNDVSKDMRLIKCYPKTSVYYYYYKKFDPINYKKPIEIPNGKDYILFVYGTNNNACNYDGFNTWNGEEKGYEYNKIEEDESGYYFSMLATGVENKPEYFVRGASDGTEELYELKSDYTQIQYVKNRRTGKFKKRKVFNNGDYRINSIGNPYYKKGQDI